MQVRGPEFAVQQEEPHACWSVGLAELVGSRFRQTDKQRDPVLKNEVESNKARHPMWWLVSVVNLIQSRTTGEGEPLEELSTLGCELIYLAYLDC